MSRVVPPEINVTSRRAPLIVGRDPGRNETLAGRPFIGQAGTLLFGGADPFTGTDIDGSVAKAGLTRRDCNITNRVLVQPYDNDFSRHNPRDVDEGLVALKSLIKDLNPSIIIATGAQAAFDLVPEWAALTDRYPGEFSGGKSIWTAGEVLDRRGFMWYNPDLGVDCPILVTLHPAACLYQPMPNRLMLDIDFSRAAAYLRGELPRQEWPTPVRVRSARDLDPIWEADLVSYDIETQWGGDRLLCLGLYGSNGYAALLYDDALRLAAEWLRSDRPKLCHNGQFDRYYLTTRSGITPGGRHEDTIVAHWATYPELAGKEDTGREDQKKKTNYTATRKGLNFLASFHLNVPWWKTYTSDTARMGQLCINDVAATMWCWQVIEPELEAMGVRPQYERQMKKIPALIRIQQRGFLVNDTLRKERIAALDARGEALKAQARTIAEDLVKSHGLTHRPNGKGHYWWYWEVKCTCCAGGTKRRLHCNRCVGDADGLGKAELVQSLWKLSQGRIIPSEAKKLKKNDLIAAAYGPCKVCEGTGKLPRWGFNPMSPTQMTSLLFDHLGVPKYCSPSGEPGADDEILGRILMWAKGDQP